jgi:hypothetical protein
MCAAIGVIGHIWLALAMIHVVIAILILKKKPMIMTRKRNSENCGWSS